MYDKVLACGMLLIIIGHARSRKIRTPVNDPVLPASLTKQIYVRQPHIIGDQVHIWQHICAQCRQVVNNDLSYLIAGHMYIAWILSLRSKHAKDRNTI